MLRNDMMSRPRPFRWGWCCLLGDFCFCDFDTDTDTDFDFDFDGGKMIVPVQPFPTLD